MINSIVNQEDIEQIEVHTLYKAIQILEESLPHNEEVVKLLRIVLSSSLDKEFQLYKSFIKPFYTFDERIIADLAIAYREHRLPLINDAVYVKSINQAIRNIMVDNTPIHHACVEALKEYYVQKGRAEDITEQDLKDFKKCIHEIYTKKRSILNESYELTQRNKPISLRYQDKDYTWTYCEFGHRLHFDTWYIKNLRNGHTPNLNNEIPQVLTNKQAIMQSEKYLDHLKQRKQQKDLPF
ncbi:hypothetical protein ABD87_22635 [Lysinibacillus sphaericus]|uniref:hypothetical protein n=1 Tax=Lysinibacillus sphaericus TaxID=1421 RepID=UPI0018CF044C|nr:hypothetical protein [Lysinibacillus sphaericus]MBG9732224.1 hypothetical protein [Lysinibacillus sphaericus]